MFRNYSKISKGDGMVENRNNRLLNAKLNKYIVPGIMMSLALQLGNIVDTIFVSNLIGVEAMSAVTMSLPVETIVSAYPVTVWVWEVP